MIREGITDKSRNKTCGLKKYFGKKNREVVLNSNHERKANSLSLVAQHFDWIMDEA